VKQLSVCLASFFSLGAIGPCMGPARPPPEPIEPTRSDGSTVSPLPVAPPRPPEPAPNISPPPPILDPKPPAVELPPEPPLTVYACDRFPPLPLVEVPTQEIIRPLDTNEATYFWQNLFCLPPDTNDPEGPPGCERLVIGTGGVGHDRYNAVFRFPLVDLPAADEIEEATLNLYPLGGLVFFSPVPVIERLDAEWWQACPSDGQSDWRPLCDTDTPVTSAVPTNNWGHWDDGENEYDWFSLDITELYRDWQNSVSANHGLKLKDVNLFSLLIFAGADHPDPTLRPRLIITAGTVRPTLRFPLDGGYEAAETRRRAKGYYDFGSWWKKLRCDGTDKPPSPRLRHTGVDWPAAVGDPVYAVYDGVVRYAETHPTDGGFVVLEHDGQWTSIYTHVIPSVTEFTYGQPTTSRRGEQIGAIARHTLPNPHLHFQVRVLPFEEPWARLGRLPEEECFAVRTEIMEREFPEKFVDPKCLDWE